MIGNQIFQGGKKLFFPLLAVVLLFSASGFSSKAEAAVSNASVLKNEASQMSVVEAAKSSSSAILQRYVKQNGKWVKYSAPIQAVVGKSGVGKGKEGDAKTPLGTYLLGTSFGWAPKPAGMIYPFKAAAKYDYWIDDVTSPDYNKWVTFKGNPADRWKSFERLNHPLYKYAVVIRYNDNPIVKGTGSAIFLHIKTSSTKYTLGCVAVNEGDLVTILKWLDPKNKPIIDIKEAKSTVKITASALNVRASGTTGSKIMGVVKKNQIFTVKDVYLNSQKQTWLRIEYSKGKVGWISASYTSY